MQFHVLYKENDLIGYF